LEWEKELENAPEGGGGRRGEWAMAALALSEPATNVVPRALNEVESGEGRLGEDANPATPEIERAWLKPADGEPATTAAGGPYGSRRGDEASRPGDWAEPD
jgi:hypothetical protein